MVEVIQSGVVWDIIKTNCQQPQTPAARDSILGQPPHLSYMLHHCIHYCDHKEQVANR